MRGAQVVGLIVVMSMLSGCAGMKSRQDMARLQSQVGLLDERITQLERSGIGETAERPMNDSLTADVGSAMSAVVPGAGASTRLASAKSSLKPSTREIQQALKNAGFYQGSVDGKMGPMTKNAVKEFQRIHGLKSDGVVGKQTWGQLRSYANLSAESGELNAAEVLK